MRKRTKPTDGSDGTEIGHSAASLTRGLAILRAFTADDATLGNQDLIERTGLPKATVSRLTTTLVHTGFLRRAVDGRAFEVGARPLGVGHAFVATSELLREAQPFLQTLADRLGVSVALAIGDGTDMLYIAYRASQRVATLRLGVGSVLPMGTTSIGHAYLWALARSTAASARASKNSRRPAPVACSAASSAMRTAWRCRCSSAVTGC